MLQRRAARITVLVTLALALAAGALAAPDRGAEVREFAEALRSGNVTTRITALKKITNSGLDDRGLFDGIRATLLDTYRVDPTNDKGVDEVSWMCKALASSGLAEYKDALARVAAEAPSEKVRSYAQQSVGLVESYAERNALLAKQSAETAGLDPEVARLVNMLRAADLRLKKDAAKVITRSNLREPRLYDVVSAELLAGAARNEDADTLAWLCKALAASGDARHRPALEQVYRGAGDEKLRKYAKQSLDTLP